MMEEQTNDSTCYANYLIKAEEEMLDDLVIPYHSEDDTDGVTPKEELSESSPHLDDELNEPNVGMVVPIKRELPSSENIAPLRRQCESAEHESVSDKEVCPVKTEVEIKMEPESAESVEVDNMRIHPGERTFPCRLCEEKFSLRRFLIVHMRTHTGEEPFSCHICQKKFFFRRLVTSHLRTHTGQKPYPCKLCERTFAKRINLTKHMRTHTGELTNHCEVCQSCSNESNLTQHKANIP